MGREPSSIVALGERRAHRRELLREHENALGFDREEVNHDEYVALLRDAVESRNSWKRILAACAPVKRRIGWARCRQACPRTRSQGATGTPSDNLIDYTIKFWSPP